MSAAWRGARAWDTFRVATAYPPSVEIFQVQFARSARARDNVLQVRPAIMKLASPLLRAMPIERESA